MGHGVSLDFAEYLLGIELGGKTCKGMEGLIKEGEELLTMDKNPILDQALIAAAQRVEHYEIAGYGCVLTYADMLGHDEVVETLKDTMDEEETTDELLTEVDCLTNLTDNTVVASLATILDKANKQNIPVFGSEIEQVKIGCLAAEGLDYVALGKQTGKMAAEILKGEKKASDMNFETITEPGFYVNEKVAENLGVTVPQDLADEAVESFTEIIK